MSFTTEVAKSVSRPRVLVELDIGIPNSQWVNNGAGIWAVDAENLYSWVDSTLLEEGFTAQEFGVIGSVSSDAARLTKVATLGALDAQMEFFYDADDRMVWIILQNYDEPSLHDIVIGVIYGYSFTEFTPEGSIQLYEGRLTGVPRISIARDPLFFGRVAYGGGAVELINADGDLDTFARDNDVYGNEARIKLGFDGLDYDDYQTIFTGFIEGITVAEDTVSVGIAEKRKQLSRAIQYVATSTNPITAIQAILTTYFAAQYDSDYFDTTAWAAALSACTTLASVNMQEAAAASDIIEGLSLAAPGIFFLTPEGKYSFKVIDTTATAATTLVSRDILNAIAVRYDPTEVISSIRVGHSRDWATTGTTQYTYTDYDEHEESSYSAYKTYKRQDYDTYLDGATSAAAWADIIYPRFVDVHGSLSVTVPIRYYDITVGDTLDVEIDRPTRAMLGTVATEILSIGWELADVPTLELGLRII